MKKLFLSLLLVFATAFSFITQAQEIINPVQWSFAINDLNDTEFELVATATIEPTYHI